MLLQGKLDDTSMQRGRDMDCLHKSSQGAVWISLKCLAKLQCDIKPCKHAEYSAASQRSEAFDLGLETESELHRLSMKHENACLQVGLHGCQMLLESFDKGRYLLGYMRLTGICMCRSQLHRSSRCTNQAHISVNHAQKTL